MSEAKEFRDAQEIFQNMVGNTILDIKHEFGERLRISLDNGKTFEIVPHSSFLPTIQEV